MGRSAQRLTAVLQGEEYFGAIDLGGEFEFSGVLPAGGAPLGIGSGNLEYEGGCLTVTALSGDRGTRGRCENGDSGFIRRGSKGQQEVRLPGCASPRTTPSATPACGYGSLRSRSGLLTEAARFSGPPRDGAHRVPR